MSQKIKIYFKENFCVRRRRAAAEVISSVLLVAITVVGAAILTSFMDETFVSGSMGVASSSESQIKSLRLIGFDTHDGTSLMNLPNLDNTNSTYQILCRVSCATHANSSPIVNGTEFVVMQIENRGVNPVFLHNVYLDGVNHIWDSSTSNVDLDSGGSFDAGNFPADGMFSILSLSNRCNNHQCENNQILEGERVNLVIKLDHTNEDIPLSKTIRTQLNVGDSTLKEFLIESGGAQ